MKGGVYVYRCRKPGLLGMARIPLLSYHWAYVGETTSFYHRDQQHRDGKPWAPLIASCHRIYLPSWKPLLRAVETLLILTLWPVYNIEKNRWNPRRYKPGQRVRPWPVVTFFVLSLAFYVWVVTR